MLSHSLPRQWLIGVLLAVALFAMLVTPGLWHRHAGSGVKHGHGPTAHTHSHAHSHQHGHSHSHHADQATDRPVAPATDTDRWHQHVSWLGWSWTVWAPQEWLAADGWSLPPVNSRSVFDWLDEFRLVPFPNVNPLRVRLDCAWLAGPLDERAAKLPVDPLVPPPKSSLSAPPLAASRA